MHGPLIATSKIASSLMFMLLSIMLVPTTLITWYNKTVLLEWVMLSIMSSPMNLHLIADPIGMLFSCTVLFISANVLSFSTVYMSHDKFINRFTILVMLFVSSMNMLIFLPHFIILLLGWDGLGFTSFILVIYYQNSRSLGAGMITALSNRIGDAMILIAIACTLHQGHWYIMNMSYNINMITTQTMLIMLAAMTKSAQMPFSSWLPAAMAAPTPVSALVHSSTLVTAGVFLLIRFYPFLHHINSFNTIITLIATSTMMMAGLSALTECDMKKIIALSTLSQLGLMMLAIGINMPTLAFFHMVTHALFKALLFICAGSLINYHMHTQDLRWMGNTSLQMPIATTCITTANMALCGLPFMSGFYSKDMIMEWAMHNPTNYIILYLSMMSIGVTSAYSLRFSMSTLWSPQVSSTHIKLTEELPIIKPMILLTVMAVISGSLMSWTNNISSISTMFIPLHMKLAPFTIIIISIIIMWYTSQHKLMSYMMKLSMLHWASCMMWFLTPLSSQFMMKYPMTNAHKMMKTMDQGFLEVPQLIHLYFTLPSNKLLYYTPSSATSHIMLSSTTIIMLMLATQLFVYSVK